MRRRWGLLLGVALPHLLLRTLFGRDSCEGEDTWAGFNGRSGSTSSASCVRGAVHASGLRSEELHNGRGSGLSQRFDFFRTELSLARCFFLPLTHTHLLSKYCREISARLADGSLDSSARLCEGSIPPLPVFIVQNSERCAAFCMAVALQQGRSE